MQSHGARSRSQAPFRHQTPCETSPSWDCLDRLNSLSPVFKIESVLIERRDAILICKQQFVDSRRDDVIDPQIRQVHTAITENTSIHLVVHSIFCNNLSLQLQLQLSEYSFFFTFHSEFMEPPDLFAKFAIWNWIMRTFFTNNHACSSWYTNSKILQQESKFCVLKMVAATHFHFFVLTSFMRQYSFAMYTTCIHHYINILLKHVSKRHQLDREDGIFRSQGGTRFGYSSND